MSYLEVHQSRTHEPTAYEYRLAAVLEEVFRTDGHDLDTVVACLNARGLQAPDGGQWTERSFRDEMRRLGV
ncbi:recombinase-like helix-turn-helix domain-containing protein [Streptomyces sp. NPDC059455]|uniref:recombinase-like helix-turn-helix domain-containing protein n=1 Tax=Streptomyces sp. NPDC059455 TaxID=3346837 RepID=UPI0036BD30D6